MIILGGWNGLMVELVSRCMCLSFFMRYACLGACSSCKRDAIYDFFKYNFDLVWTIFSI